MELEWEDVVWEDPDGGKIVLHGVLPTTVHPRQLRPRIEWHAIASLVWPGGALPNFPTGHNRHDSDSTPLSEKFPYLPLTHG